MNDWWLWKATIDYRQRGMDRQAERSRLDAECRWSRPDGAGLGLADAAILWWRARAFRRNRLFARL